jgi:DNA-binding protein YbaB
MRPEPPPGRRTDPHAESEVEPAVAAVTAELTELRLASDGEEGLTVTVDGFGRVVGVSVGPQLARRVQAERLGRLVVAVVNTARLAAGEVAGDRLRELGAGGAPGPGPDLPDWLLEAAAPADGADPDVGAPFGGAGLVGGARDDEAGGHW